jgi:hypothetical protein
MHVSSYLSSSIVLLGLVSAQADGVELTFLPSAAGVGKNPSIELDIPNEDSLLSRSAGEDAYFLSSDSLGVADGVGGWSDVEGANSARYSRMLMHYAGLHSNFIIPCSSRIRQFRVRSEASYGKQ